MFTDLKKNTTPIINRIIFHITLMYFTLSFINTVIVFIYIFGLSVFCDFAFFVTFIPLTCDDSC